VFLQLDALVRRLKDVDHHSIINLKSFPLFTGSLLGRVISAFVSHLHSHWVERVGEMGSGLQWSQLDLLGVLRDHSNRLLVEDDSRLLVDNRGSLGEMVIPGEDRGLVGLRLGRSFWALLVVVPGHSFVV
jgi:hypothetical protein